MDNKLKSFCKTLLKFYQIKISQSKTNQWKRKNLSNRKKRLEVRKSKVNQRYLN